MDKQRARQMDIWLNNDQIAVVREQEAQEAERNFKKRGQGAKADQGQQQQNKEQEKSMNWRISFKYEDHKVVKLMKPFVSQIITDIKRKADQID